MVALRRVLIFAALLLMFDMLASWLAFCQPIDQQQTAQNGTQEYGCAFHGPFVALFLFGLRGLAAFLKEYEHELVAGFTIVLGISTILLWFSTRDAARAAQAAAEIAERALTDLEGPLISVKIRTNGIEVPPVGKTLTLGILKFAFANYGRSPARILEFLDDSRVVAPGALPPAIDDEIERGQEMPYGVLSPQEDETQTFEHNLFARVTMKVLEDPSILSRLKDMAVFFRGFVVYEGALDKKYRLGFCFLFDTIGNRWVLAGGKEHNYHRRIDDWRSPSRTPLARTGGIENTLLPPETGQSPPSPPGT